MSHGVSWVIITAKIGDAARDISYALERSRVQGLTS